ncbi:MAG: Phosphatidylinositol mannoside acyltransferase [candidate division NC10 bacterium]|nr:Phosphatidylinositol mannoside acyltransferase [candidate division NC10 bacterium]
MSDDPRPDEGRWHQHGLSTGLIFGLTRWGVTHLPKAVSYAIGHVGTWIAFHLMKAETAALIDNYRVILPHRTERELRALTLHAYRTYAREVIDFIRSTTKTAKELWTWMSPLNNFDRVGRPGENGFLFVTAHVGNIELGAVVLRALYEYRLAVVLLPEHDPRVHQHRLEMRRKMGIETIEVRQDAETALRIRRFLSGGGTVAMVADRPLGRDRVEVEFFGRRISFLRSPAIMAYLSGAPMIPSFILRQPDGSYAGLALDPIHVDRSGDRETAVQAAMQAFATALEGVVRQHPHLWYNFFPYWTTTNDPDAATG